MRLTKRYLVSSLALTAAACNAGGDSKIDMVDRCFILVAQVSPALPHLQVGDTVTMRAAFFQNVSPDCLPSDTTAAGLRWVSTDSAALPIAAVTGLLTARSVGTSQIILTTAHSGGGVLGTTFATVP
jgi:uncharacterized protein YjdB